MKLTKNYIYTIEELKNNLAVYHDDILCKSTMEAIKAQIIADGGKLNLTNIENVIELNASLCPVDFKSMASIQDAIKYLAPVIIPEVVADLLDNDIEFTVTVIGVCSIHSSTIEY